LAGRQKADRKADTYIDRVMRSERQTDRQTDRQKDRMAGRQEGRHIHSQHDEIRETDKLTNIQTDTEIKRKRERNS